MAWSVMLAHFLHTSTVNYIYADAILLLRSRLVSFLWRISHNISG